MFRGSHRLVPAAIVTIHVKQCGKGWDIADIRDGYRRPEPAFEGRSQCRTTDTPEAVQCNPGHFDHSFIGYAGQPLKARIQRPRRPAAPARLTTQPINACGR
jgi:hypothetical protein